MSVVGPSLLSLLFVVIGVFILRHARGVAAKARQSLAWPSTTGVVAHSSVSPPSAAADETTWAASVAYQYQVKGKSYSSTNISLADVSTSSENRARAIAERYPRNAQVVVFYNPANPSEAVLERSGGGGVTLLSVIGAAFGGVGLFLLVLSLTGRISG